MKSVESWQTEKDDNKEIDVVMGKNIVLSSEIEKIRLRLENKLRLFFNEWFLHKNEGIYWIKRNENNGQVGNLLEKFNIETQIKETILADEDVAEIIKFESDFKNGTGNYNFDVEILLKNGKTLTIWGRRNNGFWSNGYRICIEEFFRYYERYRKTVQSKVAG